MPSHLNEISLQLSKLTWNIKKEEIYVKKIVVTSKMDYLHTDSKESVALLSLPRISVLRSVWKVRHIQKIDR